MKQVRHIMKLVVEIMKTVRHIPLSRERDLVVRWIF